MGTPAQSGVHDRCAYVTGRDGAWFLVVALCLFVAGCTSATNTTDAHRTTSVAGEISSADAGHAGSERSTKSGGAGRLSATASPTTGIPTPTRTTAALSSAAPATAERTTAALSSAAPVPAAGSRTVVKTNAANTSKGVMTTQTPRTTKVAPPTSGPPGQGKSSPRATGTVGGRVTPVPAPSGGSIHDVISSVKAGPVARVSITGTAELTSGAVISVPSIKRFVAQAQTPGEITGPAVAVHVLIRNGSKSPINLNSVIVTLTDDKGFLGQPTTSTPYQPFSGTIAPGAAQRAAYVFLLPKTYRNVVSISVTYIPGMPSGQFVGTIS